MDNKTDDKRDKIIDTLCQKSVLKQSVYNNTFEVFNTIKEILHDISDDLNEVFENRDDAKQLKLDYRDRGKFEAEIRFSGDVLIFSMHTNVFEFDRDHPVWKTSYVQNNSANSYCGMINIYNFLSDSFKYNRNDDLGYLVGRIFINREMCYFVEGKRQIGFLYNNFGNEKVGADNLKKIIESAILYTLEFDLLVPPYDAMKIATVEQLNTKIEDAKMRTGKRLGYQFNSDDVSNPDKV